MVMESMTAIDRRMAKLSMMAIERNYLWILLSFTTSVKIA